MTFNKFLLVFIFCFPILLNAQNKIDYQSIDSSTYIQYINKDWKSLIQTSKLGLKNGIDYYYLRMRKGIAEFELENYFKATADFNKALALNEYDKTAKSYRYFSLLNSGKKTMAYKFSNQFSNNQKNELKINIKTVDDLTFFGGYSLSDNYRKNGSLNLLAGDTATYGEQLLMGDQMYFHLGTSLNLSPTFSLYASLSYLNIDKRERFQYLLKDEVIEQVFDDPILQTEVYLNGKLQLNKGWSLNIFSNLLFLGTTQRLASLVIDSTNQEEYDYLITANDTTFLDWVAGFNLQKDLNYVVIDWGGTVSKFYENQQYLTSLSATYYPFGNFKFYGKTCLIYFYEPEASFDHDASRIIFSQSLGIQLAKMIWIEGEYTLGDLKNVNMKQGLVVYNLPDKINYMAGAKLNIFVSKHVSLNIQYQFYDKSGLYINFAGANNTLYSYSTNYQTHNIIGGIKWRF